MSVLLKTQNNNKWVHISGSAVWTTPYITQKSGFAIFQGLAPLSRTTANVRVGQEVPKVDGPQYITNAVILLGAAGLNQHYICDKNIEGSVDEEEYSRGDQSHLSHLETEYVGMFQNILEFRKCKIQQQLLWAALPSWSISSSTSSPGFRFTWKEASGLEELTISYPPLSRVADVARTAFAERSRSSTKGSTPNIQHFAAKVSTVTIFALFGGFCRALDESHPASVDLWTKVNLLL